MNQASKVIVLMDHTRVQRMNCNPLRDLPAMILFAACLAATGGILASLILWLVFDYSVFG